MDVGCVLQDPELALTDRHSSGRCRLPVGFAQSSKRLSELHPGTEPVPSRTLSMGRLPPGHRRIREPAQSYRIHQISTAQSSRLFTNGHHIVLQGAAAISGSGRIRDLGVERSVRTFCDHRVPDRRASPAGVHFIDRGGLVYGWFATDSSGNSGRISRGGFRRS
jgi:hypothetical protein